MIRQDWSTLKKLMFMKAAAGGSVIEDTATGNPLTFNTNVAKPLRSLLIPFTPTQSGTGDPSPENVRPIAGITGLTAWRTGRNMILNGMDASYSVWGITFVKNADGSVTYSGTAHESNSAVCYIENPFHANIPPGEYVFSIGADYTKMKGDSVVQLTTFKKADDSVSKRIACKNTTESRTFTLEGDEYVGNVFIRINYGTGENPETTIYPMLRPSSDESEVYAPYTGESFPVDWTDEAGTVYGGTLDLVTGVLTVEYIAHTFTENDELNQYGTYTDGIRLNSNVLDNTKSGGSSSVCNLAKKIANTPSTIDILCYRISGGLSRTAIFVPDSMFDDGATVNKFKEWLSENEFTICAELETPQEIQLTPEQITALVGNNTIWSDTNGENTAVYLKKA